MTLKKLLGAVLPFALSGVVFACPAGAQSAATGRVSGTVTDNTGHPVAGARVDLNGPATYVTTSDTKGAFQFATVSIGTYTLSASRAGFDPASYAGVTVLAGSDVSYSLSLSIATLQTIAVVKSAGGGQVHFNTTSASVGVATNQDFANQAQNQISAVLNQIPGIQISLPSGSTNGAAPGSVTVPSIRGAASYETASFIDGHAVATSSYGDYVTTYLNPFLFGDIEVVKGPGAFGVEVNSAINGAVNFRTRNPTATPSPDYEVGLDNHGGAFGNVAISDTILDGRLGFVFALANVDSPSALNGKSVYIDPSGGLAGAHGPAVSGNATYSNIDHTESNIQTGYSLVACCYTLSSNYNSTSELAKLRYRISPTTVATVSYLDGQVTTDQNGNTGNFTNAVFNPGKGYKGSLAPGPLLVDYLFPGSNNVLHNVEPIFQAEVSSGIGNDTVVARYYHASIYRATQQGTSANVMDPYRLTLYGLSGSRSSSATTYNGTTLPIYFSDFFNETEADKLGGWSFEYDHPFDPQNQLVFSADQNTTQSQSYSLSSFTNVSIPQGSSQLFTTLRLQGNVRLSPQVTATLADYANVYRSTYATSCPFSGPYSNCSIAGDNATFQTTTTSHNDPRFGFVWQPGTNLAVRLGAGSAIAPPYLNLLSLITAPYASWDQQLGRATLVKNSGQLRPETAFGYDLGADYRFGDTWTVASGDVYDNNLYNHYFGETLGSGLTCGQVSYPCLNQSQKKAPASTPIYYMLNTNISNFRFQGIELSLKRSPPVGWGFYLSGALQKGYVFNLPQYFYCSNPGPKCQYDQNLNIIANQNLNGEGIGFGSTIGSLNTRIPYAQGNASVSYTFRNRAYALLGMTYYGNNNSLGEPPFGIGYATVRYPVAPSTALQVSGNNIFNAWPSVIPTYGSGLSIPLADGGTAATLGNVLGPATWSFLITKNFAP